MPLVIEAIRREYRKQGRSVNEADLRLDGARPCPPRRCRNPRPVALEVVR